MLPDMSEMNPSERERYPLNAKGDFYVENGICLCCMIPEIEAPELMDFNKTEMHCFFKCHSLTEQEREHAIQAVASSDIQGLRYAGNDRYVLDRLVALGAADCCDVLKPKEGSKPSEDENGLLKYLSEEAFWLM